MRKIIQLIVILIIFTTCSEKKNNKVKIETVIVNEDSIILNKWMMTLLKSNPKINSKSIDSANLGQLKNTYFLIPSDTFKAFKSDIEFNLSNQIPKIIAIDGAITLDFSNYNFIKYFIFKDKFIYSYHLASGNNGHSVIYDFSKRETTQFYFIDSITKNSAFVIREKYSFDENNPGHHWQRGQLNFNTNKIVWGKWD